MLIFTFSTKLVYNYPVEFLKKNLTLHITVKGVKAELMCKTLDMLTLDMLTLDMLTLDMLTLSVIKASEVKEVLCFLYFFGLTSSGISASTTSTSCSIRIPNLLSK